MKFISKLITKVFAARTVANDPLQKYMFRVTIPGMPTGMGFNKVGGLTKEVGVIEYMEGMYAHTHKLPGKEKVPKVTLEKGTFATAELENYYKATLTNPNMRSTVIIEIFNRFGEVKKKYQLAEAWASKWEGTDLDAGSEDVAIEKITVQFEYYL